MRRLLLLAFAAIALGAPLAAHAQYSGGGGGQGADDDDKAQQEAAKKREKDKEWSDVQAPLPELRNAGPCPFVKSLYDASRYIEFSGDRDASADVGFTGEIQSIGAACQYKEAQPITMAMQVLFELGKGPQATASNKTYRYWVAVTDRNREVIARQDFELPVKFPEGKDRVYLTDSVANIVIPRGTATTSGANFEVLVGFDVTPQMAEFNRLGKRFRVNAGVAAGRVGRLDRGPMSDLKTGLGEAVAAAFARLGLPAELGRVTASDRPDLADFQSNGALAAAKQVGRNPRELAAAVAAELAGDPRLGAIEIAGPGFINLKLTDGALSARAQAIAADPRLGAERVAQPRRVLVDYGGPNVAKPMHVGHLRASIIGESIKRLYRFRGDEVLGDAHFGDWGYQMGLLIGAVMDEAPAVAKAVDALNASQPADPAAFEAITLADLDRLYPAGGRAGGTPTRTIASARASSPRACRPALPATTGSGAGSAPSPRSPCSATSMRWASTSTSGRARATSRT